MHFHVCETQHTRMHVTDTTATPNGHQMAVVTWDRSIACTTEGNHVDDVIALKANHKPQDSQGRKGPVTSTANTVSTDIAQPGF